jgi:hypothetical protein
MKKTGTLSPGLGVSETTLKMPASGSTFTSVGLVQSGELTAAAPPALAAAAGLALAAVDLAPTAVAGLGLAAAVPPALAAAPGLALAPAELAVALELPRALAATLGFACAVELALAAAATLEGAALGLADAAPEPQAARSNDSTPAIAGPVRARISWQYTSGRRRRISAHDGTPSAAG